jgi:hypothetical protein
MFTLTKHRLDIDKLGQGSAPDVYVPDPPVQVVHIPLPVTGEMAEAFRDALHAWERGPKSYSYRFGCVKIVSAVLRSARQGRVTVKTQRSVAPARDRCASSSQSARR